MKKTFVKLIVSFLAVCTFPAGMDFLVSAINIWTGLFFGLICAVFLGYGLFKYAGLPYLIVVYIILVFGVSHYFFSPVGGIGVFAGAGYSLGFSLCYFSPFAYLKRRQIRQE